MGNLHVCAAPQLPGMSLPPACAAGCACSTLLPTAPPSHLGDGRWEVAYVHALGRAGSIRVEYLVPSLMEGREAAGEQEDG